ncbi:MAG: tripartite tricarboxylate transporter substrate-binding protein [Dermatophilaceae bacterium]
MALTLSSSRRSTSRVLAVVAAGALSLTACGSSGSSSTGAGAGSNYPTGTITMVVPFSAGGPTDTVARLVAEPMSKTLGQQIIVQNVEGAGGTLGAGEVAKAKNDGYKILMHHIGMSTAPALYSTLAFKPLESFQTIGLVTEVPMTIISKKDLPPTNFKELVDYVKANKDKVTYANAGIGSASQLCGLLIEKAFGVDLTEVPYKGTGPAMTDLVGGQVDFMCDQTTNTSAQIKPGKVKAFAVTTSERVKSLPDIPTTTESGMPELKVGVWHGLYAPAGTPEAVTKKLTEALALALKDPKVIEKMADLGTAPEAADQVNPAAHTAKLKAQLELWTPVIKAAGVKAA